MISKVTDLPQQDFIDVLEVVDTAGGIFFPCSSLPFFGGVGYLTKIHTKNRLADRVNSVTFTTSKLNNNQTTSFQFSQKFVKYSLNVLNINNVVILS